MAYKIIESPIGVGEVLKAGKHLCKVYYRIQHRENTETGIGEISGDVTVDEAERMSVEVLNSMMSGQVFTLRLADNRSLQVFFNKGDAFTGVYRVVNSGNGFAAA